MTENRTYNEPPYQNWSELNKEIETVLTTLHNFRGNFSEYQKLFRTLFQVKSAKEEEQSIIDRLSV